MAILFAAFYIHWILFLCLTVVVMEVDSGEMPICLNALFGPTEAPPAELTPVVSMAILDQSSTLETSQPAVTTSAEEILHAMTTPADDSDVLLPDAVSALAIASSQAKTGPTAPAVPAASASEASSAHPNAPANAVTAGSFAVWTEPANPEPEEPYRIIVQIRIPEGTLRYPVSDLDGVVLGSDGYRKLIPGALRGFLPVADGQVRLEIPIVSADENVEDTVMIRSRLLREAHRMKLHF
ncbi:MAG: hypothetical protein ACK526_05700 [Planctomyces sp.]